MIWEADYTFTCLSGGRGVRGGGGGGRNSDTSEKNPKCIVAIAENLTMALFYIPYYVDLWAARRDACGWKSQTMWAGGEDSYCWRHTSHTEASLMTSKSCQTVKKFICLHCFCFWLSLSNSWLSELSNVIRSVDSETFCKLGLWHLLGSVHMHSHEIGTFQ